MPIHTKRRQQLDPLKYFLDLSRGMLGRRFPKAALHCGTALVRLRHGRSPLRQQQRVNRFDDGTGEPCLVLTDRLDDHHPQITFTQHDQSMLVEPATCTLQQPLPIARACQFIAQYPRQRTPQCVR